MVHGNRVDYCGSERADIHLGHGVPVRPNTLKQTAQEIKKQLANRAGHTFPLRAGSDASKSASEPKIDPHVDDQHLGRPALAGDAEGEPGTYSPPPSPGKPPSSSPGTSRISQHETSAPTA